MAKTKEVRSVPESLLDAISITLEQHIPPSLRTLSIEKLADELGIKQKSYIYRWIEDDNSYAPITLDKARTLMDVTGNLAILDYLERRYGRMAIPLPKGTLPKEDESEMLDEYRELTMDALNSLKTFFKSSNIKTQTDLNRILEKIIKKSASIQKYSEKKLAGQFELELKQF